MAKKAGNFSLGKAGPRPTFAAAPTTSQTGLNTFQRADVAWRGQVPAPPQRVSESNSNPSLPSSSQLPSQYQAFASQAAAYPQDQAFQNYAQYCSVCWAQAGTFCCSSCSQTAVLLCGSCISTHFATEGYHCIRKLELLYEQAPNPNAEHCSLCRYYSGTVICCCQLPAVVLCNQCIQSHIGMLPYAVHTHLPVQAKAYVTSQKYIEKLRNRQMGKEQAKQALTANVLKIEEAEQVVVKTCSDLIEAIHKQQGEWLTELNSVKSDLTRRIDEAVKEAEDHIYEEKFESQNDLATAIWNYSLRPTTEFEIFTYKSRPDVLTNSLKKIFHVQFDIEILHFPCHIPYIPVLVAAQIKRFDYRDEEWLAPMTIPQNLQQTAWMVISDKELFVLAGNNSYIVEIETGNIKTLTGLQNRGQQTHMACGIAVYDDRLYLFGGQCLQSGFPSYNHNQTHNASDRLSLSSKEWTQLSNMTDPRASFTPCFYKKLFYLVGGMQINSIETFSPETEKFTKLALTIPQAGQCVSFFDGGELVVLQGTSVYKNKLHENEASFRVSTCATNFTVVTMPPVKYQNSVFLINNNSIIKFDAAKLTHQNFT